MSDEDWGRWREALRYDPETGKLYWRHRPASHFTDGKVRPPEENRRLWNAKNAGNEALKGRDNYGYLKGRVFGRNVRAHRAAWFLTYGHWPEEIDHINGDRADNRLCNLRACGREGNVRNTAVARGTSRFRGVQRKESGKFAAKIRYGGRQHHLGTFESEDAAAAAYSVAAARHHGEFAGRAEQTLREIAENIREPEAV